MIPKVPYQGFRAKRRGVAAFTGPSFLLMIGMVNIHFYLDLTNAILQLVDLFTLCLDTVVLIGIISLKGANAVPQFLNYDFQVKRKTGKETETKEKGYFLWNKGRSCYGAVCGSCGIEKSIK